MLAPFSSEDLGRVFDARTLPKGRTLILLGTVQVTLQDPSVAITVEHGDGRHTASFTPGALDRSRVVLLSECSCAQRACAHVAAGALAALDRFPALRRPAQRSFLDTLTAPAVAPATAAERQRLVFELSPGTPPHACFLSALLVGERTGTAEPTSPARVLADPANGGDARAVAKLLGGGADSRAPVASGAVASVLGLLARMGRGRWHATGQALALGPDRPCAANVPPSLPAGSGVILGDAGPWYVDGATGAVGRIRVLPPVAAPFRAAPPAAPPFTPAVPAPHRPPFSAPYRPGLARPGIGRPSAPQPPPARRTQPAVPGRRSP